MRIGLLLEGWEVGRSEYEAIRELLEHQPVEVSLVAINSEKLHPSGEDGSDAKSIPRLRRFVGELSRNNPGVLIDADFQVAKVIGERHARKLDRWWTSHDVRELFEEYDHEPATVHYEAIPLKNEFGYRLPDPVVDRFSEDTEVILSFEHWMLKGEILHATDHGVVSHHGGDIRKYRGRPGCIWELLDGADEIGKTVQVLTPVLDGGKPLSIRTREVGHYPTLWQMKLYQKEMFVPMLADAVETLRDPEREPAELEEVGDLSHSSDKQRWSIVVRVLARHWYHRVRKSIDRASPF